MNNANIIWQTDKDPETEPEFDITRNVELRFDAVTGCVEVRVTAQTLREDQSSLAKLLTPLEAIEMGVELIDAARKQLVFEE